MGFGISGRIGREFSSDVAQQIAQQLAMRQAEARMAAEQERIQLERQQLAQQAARDQENVAFRQSEQQFRREGREREEAQGLAEDLAPGTITPEQAAILAKSPRTQGRVSQRQILQGVRPIAGTGPLDESGPQSYAMLDPTRAQAEAAGKEARRLRLIEGLSPRDREIQEKVESGIAPGIIAQQIENSPEARAQKDQEWESRTRRAAQIGAQYRQQPREQRDVVVQTANGPMLINTDTGQARPIMAGDQAVGGAQSQSGKANNAQALRVLNEIDNLSQGINTEKGGLSAIFTGLKRRGKAQLQMDNPVSEYESLIAGFTPLVARAVGHVGVLTQQDVESVYHLFPSLRDNSPLARNKLARVRRLLSAGPQQGETFQDRLSSAWAATATPDENPSDTATEGMQSAIAELEARRAQMRQRR